MNSQKLSHLTRRTSLSALFATGVAAVLARNQAGHAKQSVSKKAKKKCKKQEAQCNQVISTSCQPGDSECLVAVARCCAFTAQCDIAGFFTCSQAVI